MQTPGKLKIDVKDLGVDFLSLSAHKLHAPKGIGLLYVKRKTKYQPYVIGGGQERGRRGGTENVANIVGFGRAAELAMANLPEENTRVRALRDRLEDGILNQIPGAVRNGAREPRLPNTTNLSFDGVEAEGILMLLDQAGHLRFERFGLHLRFAGSFARADGDGLQRGAGARQHPLQPRHLQHRGRSGVRPETSAADHCPAAGARAQG